MALELARNRRLAHYFHPFGHQLLPPPPGRGRRINHAHLHETTPVSGRHRDRRHHRLRRLPLRVRRGAAPGVDVGLDYCVPAGVHGGVRVPAGETEVHVVLDKRGRSNDDWRGSFGIAHEWGPPRRRINESVRGRVLDDGGGGVALRIRFAAGGINVQKGEAANYVHFGPGNSAGYVLIRHSRLHRWDVNQQRFSGPFFFFFPSYSFVN